MKFHCSDPMEKSVQQDCYLKKVVKVKQVLDFYLRHNLRP